jgi:hypothetical protein
MRTASGGKDGLRPRPGASSRPARRHRHQEWLAFLKTILQARWSCRTMAREAGISQASVQRLWATNDIKPHLSRTFKLSKDKQFEAKFWDVIGLYLDPPEKALAPIVHRHPRYAQPGGDLCLRHAGGPQQDDLSPLTVPHRDRGSPNAALQFPAFGGVQRNLAANHQSLSAAGHALPTTFLSTYLRGTTLVWRLNGWILDDGITC